MESFLAALGSDFVQLSLVPIVIGVLASIACAIPGNFLILRKQALIGDAISHVVLPGIVVAFLLTGQVSAWPMMIGAAGAAIVAVVLIELTQRLGRVEPGAAMGVIFTTLFAFGVLLLEQSDTSGVHLDVEHALYGNLESLIWLSATGWPSLFDLQALQDLPPQVLRLLLVVVLVTAFVIVFWKELALASFDETFARSLGIATHIIGFALVVVVAVAAVVAFDVVGSILVIAMFICPPAAARLMTDRLDYQILWSIVFASFAAVFGYILAGYGPLWFGFSNALSAAGMIATVSGVILGVCCVFGPKRRSNSL